MSIELKTRLEETFFSLPEDQRGSIISLGVTMEAITSPQSLDLWR